VKNAQVAGYLAYAGRAGHAMIDRELYLRIPGSATCSGAPFASPLVGGTEEDARPKRFELPTF
jgi:hypothetical protein